MFRRLPGAGFRSVALAPPRHKPRLHAGMCQREGGLLRTHAVIILMSSLYHDPVIHRLSKDEGSSRERLDVVHEE